MPRPLIYGALTVFTLDGLDACIVSWIRRGFSPVRVFQGVAYGLLGPAALNGGVPTALLGLLIHFVVASTVVAVCYAIALRLPLLVEHPIACGAVYGVLVYLFMYRVVMPLSYIGTPHPPLSLFLSDIFIHVFGIGIPAAWFATQAVRSAKAIAFQRS